MHINATQAGGGPLEGSNEEVTIIPTVLMAEGVTNGALKLYDRFSKDYFWFEGTPIIGPHKNGDGPVTHKDKKYGQIRKVRLNADKKRVEAEAVLFNNMFYPDDLVRIKAGEQFGGSIGFYADDEPLPSGPQKWPDGQTYDHIETNFFGDHFSIVANPACKLGKCGFNVNAKIDIKETDTMTDKPEDKMVEATVEVKANANADASKVEETVKEAVKDALKANEKIDEKKPDEDLAVKVNTLFATVEDLKVNLASKDKEIADLKADKTLRENAAKAAEETLFMTKIFTRLTPAAQMDFEKVHAPAIKANFNQWVIENSHLFKGQKSTEPITPAGQPFVPHVNASDDEESEYTAIGVPTAEDIAKTMKGVI